MKEQPSELQLIRRALLQAAAEEYQEALDAVPEAPPFSTKYRRWEKTFLRNPTAVLRAAPQFHRPQWRAPSAQWPASWSRCLWPSDRLWQPAPQQGQR